MKIGEFLKGFRLGVKPKALSVATLADMLKIKPETIRNAEKGFTPRGENERKSLKTYFLLENIDDIPENKLVEILNTYNLHFELKNSTTKKLEDSDKKADDNELKTNTGKNDNSINPDNIHSQSKINGDETMNVLLEIMKKQAETADKDAEARLLDARTRDRLSSILERMERKLETEGMQVKQMEH